MYRTFAPFFMGDKGDRRVTGCNTIEKGHFALLYRLLTVKFSREFRGVVARRQALSASCSHVPTPCFLLLPPPLCPPLTHPVTLLSPLSPMKKGANPLWQAVLSPCHPFSRIIPYGMWSTCRQRWCLRTPAKRIVWWMCAAVRRHQK